MTPRYLPWQGLLAVFLLLFLSKQVHAQCATPIVGCPQTDLTNSGFNSNSNAATIEYDNNVSSFHTTVVRTSDGSFQVWGEKIAANGSGNLLSALTLNAANFPALGTATPLKVALGSTSANTVQGIVLATDGLYAWSTEGTILSNSLTSGTVFQKLTFGDSSNGLPIGVSPGDVKMMFATYQTLALTTCSGELYVLSQNANLRGLGGGGNSTTWARVTTDEPGNPALSDVVACRGANGVLMALRDDGSVYVWGQSVYTGNNSGATTRNRATAMTLPSNITVKMIATTANGSGKSHYILATDGNLYALGENSNRQLGDFSTTDRLSWVQPRYSSTSSNVMNNIKWVTAQEHDTEYASVNVINDNATLYAFGDNNYSSIGGGSGTTTNPRIPSGLQASDEILTAETGGHTTIIIKSCDPNFGYVGHRIRGSMGNNSNASETEANYTFNTAPVQSCGAESTPTIQPVALGSENGDYCALSSLQLNPSPAGGTLSLVSGPGTLTGNILTFTGSGTVSVRYELATACGGSSFTVRNFEATTCTADLSITKTVDILRPVVGENVVFSVTVRNNGPSIAQNVTVADALPSGYSLVGTVPSIGTFDGAIWTVGTMADQAEATLTVTATINNAGNFTNVATATATQTDPNLSDNTSSVAVDPRVNDTCDTNVLQNPSFELPVQPVINGNNLHNSPYAGWSTLNGAQLNIIRVDGSNYISGPNQAHGEGNQYLDMASATDYPTQTFTLSSASSFSFSAWFANRDTQVTPGTYEDWTARIDILDENNEIVASSVAIDFTVDTPEETWFFVSGQANFLPAGTYTFRGFVGDYGHMDDAFLCINAGINAIDDDYTATPIPVEGGTTPSVFTNDTNYGISGNVNENTVTVSMVSGPVGVTINNDGTIVVPPGLPAGPHTVTYTICENAPNGLNCDTASAVFIVDLLEIDAVNDAAASPVNGLTGNNFVLNALSNDTLNNTTVIESEVTLTVTIPATPIVENALVPLLASNGDLSVPVGTPAGYYTITYQLCEVLNPTNCDTATVSVTVIAAPIVANDNTNPTPVNGLIGGDAGIDIFDNDTLNGTTVNPSDVALTSTPNGPLTINADGTVSVNPNTPAGSYEIDYTICEVLNPTNCDTATVSVTVIAAPIVANDNTNPTPINGLTGGDAGIDIFDNDTLNGIAVNSSDVTLTSTPNGPLTINADGTVSINQNTPAGSYDIDYTICEVLNPTNCDTATVTVTVVAAPIVANDNTNPTPINGLIGGDAGIDIFDNDTLNGSLVDPSDVTLTSTPNGPLTINADGTVSVDPNTPAGSYDIDYTICEVLNPTNCDTATVSVTVVAAPIVANDNTNPTPINGLDGGDAGIDIFDNDTLNGSPVDPSDVTLTSTPNGPLTINADGTVSVDPITPEGSYDIDYTICEVLNPTNCDTATVSVTVIAAPIVANDNTNPTPVNGLIGGDAGINIFDNDTLNGTPVDPSDVTLTSTPNGPLTVNPDGTVSVSPNTPEGTYTVDYTICEILNPTNCSTATVTIEVIPAEILAIADTNPTPINGLDGGDAGINIFDNDTLNGIAVNPSDVTLTSTPNGPLTINADGTVSVSPNTPAGSYDIDYTICEVLNPTNCDTATVTVTVIAAQIVANDNTNPTPVNGQDGGDAGINIFDNDTLNGIAVNPSDVTLTSTPNGPLTINADGTVSVDPNTPAGSYDIDYTICEVLNSTNCDTATVTVTVIAALIVANDNTNPTPVNGLDGGDAGINIFDNDTLNGIAVDPSDVTLTSTPNGPLTVNPDGTVSVSPNTPEGTYTVDYTICEILNPTNCSTATVTIEVIPAEILAVADTNPTPINGLDGGDAGINIFDNDTLNGAPVDPSDVTLTSTPNGPLTVNPDGTVSVSPNTAEGIYTVDYTICEILNPTNCSTATVTILVQVPSFETIKSATFNDENGDGIAQVGETVQYNFAVTNTGTMELENITISDPLVAVNGGPISSLAVGVTDNNTFSAIYTLTQADIDAGSVSNQAFVTANPIAGPSITNPTDSDDASLPGDTDVTVITIPQNASMELLKESNYVDTNNDGIINPGDVINYSFTVTNNGNVTLNDINVIDPMVTVIGGLISLAPNQSDSTTFTASYTITIDDVNRGAVYNIAMAEAIDPAGNPVDVESIDPTPLDPNDPLYQPSCPSCTVTILVQTPSIALIKTAVFNDENNNGIAEAGETITYNFVVTNTGNVLLNNIIINDPLPGIVMNGGPISLAPGASDATSFVATYAITQADIINGSVSNQATVFGTSPLGIIVSDLSDAEDILGDGSTVLPIEGCTIIVHNAITPNNDGMNDELRISGIECYPDNKVEIYNRWGVLVFEVSGYDNTSKVFRGYSEGRTNISQGEGLPSGTYFYILEYKTQDGSTAKKDGYLYVNRN